MNYAMQITADIELLMIGKTGTGKSALGNSILRRTAFTSKSSFTSVTKDIAYEFGEHNGRTIKVVDGPGVGDTRMNNEKAISLVMGAMKYAISASPMGYHAFLLVVRFGGRFTAEDQDTIKFLKKMFGEYFIKSYCILVMTCGDNFEIDSEDSGQTFKQWCAEQDGVFKELLRECNNRVILFDNRTKDQVKKNNQISELIKMVDQFNPSGRRYTDKNFEQAKVSRERSMLNDKMLREETIQETSLIIYKLHVVQHTFGPEDSILHLEELLTRSKKLYDTISAQDNGNGALLDLVQRVKSIQNMIGDEIELSQRKIAEKETFRKKEEERERRFKEELKKQKETYERRIERQRKMEEQKKQLLEKQELELTEIKERRRKEIEEVKAKFRKEAEMVKLRHKTEVIYLETQYQKPCTIS